MEGLIMKLDPVTAAVIVLTLRFAMHALDKVGELVADNGPRWYAAWPFWRSSLKLLAVGSIPAWVAVKAGMNGVPAAGVLGSIGTGLAMSAIVSDLHLIVKGKGEKKTAAKLQTRLDDAKERIDELKAKLKAAAGGDVA